MTRSEILARADELVDRDRAVHTGTCDYPEGAVRIAARWILARVAGLNADNEARAVSSIPDETRERALSLAGDAVRVDSAGGVDHRRSGLFDLDQPLGEAVL